MVLDKDFHQFYLADDPLAIVPLAVKDHFDALSEEEKLYVHALSLAIPKTAKVSVADVILVPPFLVLEFCFVSLALNLN